MKILVVFFVLLSSFISSASIAEQTAPVVTIKDRGKSPYQKLRYRIANGTQQLHMTMEMGIRIPDQPKVNTPPIKMSGEISSQKTVTGDYKSHFTMNKYTVVENTAPVEIIEAMKAEMANLPPLNGWQITSELGEIIQTGYDLENISNVKMKNQLESFQQQAKQLAVPFPKVSIGVGGSWQVTQQMIVNGMNLIQTVTYEITAIENNLVTLKTALLQEIGDKNLEAPNLPPGTTATIEKLDSSGAGTVVVDMTKITPKSTMTMQTDFTVVVEMDGQQEKQSMSMDVHVEITD